MWSIWSESGIMCWDKECFWKRQDQVLPSSRVRFSDAIDGLGDVQEWYYQWYKPPAHLRAGVTFDFCVGKHGIPLICHLSYRMNLSMPQLSSCRVIFEPCSAKKQEKGDSEAWRIPLKMSFFSPLKKGKWEKLFHRFNKQFKISCRTSHSMHVFHCSLMSKWPVNVHKNISEAHGIEEAWVVADLIKDLQIWPQVFDEED